MFNFVFDKKSLALLLGGLTVAGGLLFFAGLLVGVNLGLPGLHDTVAYVPPPPRPLPVKQEAKPCPDPVVPAQMKPVPKPAPLPAPPAPAPVVEPAPAPPPQIARQEPEPRAVQAALREPAGSGAFSVQVGAFRVKENSDALIEELKGRGYETYVETAGTLHIVRVGRYADRGEAQKVASELHREKKLDAVVRQVRQL